MCLRSPAIGVAIVCALSSSTTADYAIIGDDMGVGLSCAAKFHSLAKIGVTIQPLAVTSSSPTNAKITSRPQDTDSIERSAL
jgi:hypothetical protein